MGELVDKCRLDEGFVALNVEDVGGLGVRFRSLGESIRASGMIGGGHHGLASEGGDGISDAGVVGGDEDLGEEFGILAALPDMLDQGFSSNEVEGLSGEACGTPACWEYADNFRFLVRFGHAMEKVGRAYGSGVVNGKSGFGKTLCGGEWSSR